MKTVRILLLAVLPVFALGGCRQKSAEKPVQQTWLTMGTFASVTLRGDDRELLRDCFTTTAECFSNINTRLSTYIPQSEISRINATDRKLAVSQLTYDMVKTTLRYCDISGGAFDPTVKPLIKLWGFNGAEVPTNLPSPVAVSAALETVGYEKIRISRTETAGVRRYFLQSPVAVDLGGIAKGYAVDRAYDLLVGKYGAPDGRPNMLINLGGNIRCHGRAAPGRKWRIGVRNPFVRNELVGVLELDSGMAVATSGNYERFVMIEGRRYAHIIDPRSGYPVQGMAEVTVVSESATETDAMSTAFYVAGPSGAAELLKKIPRCGVLMIPDSKPMSILVSGRMRNIFTPFDEYRDNVRDL